MPLPPSYGSLNLMDLFRGIFSDYPQWREASKQRKNMETFASSPEWQAMAQRYGVGVGTSPETFARVQPVMERAQRMLMEKEMGPTWGLSSVTPEAGAALTAERRRPSQEKEDIGRANYYTQFPEIQKLMAGVDVLTKGLDFQGRFSPQVIAAYKSITGKDLNLPPGVDQDAAVLDALKKALAEREGKAPKPTQPWSQGMPPTDMSALLKEGLSRYANKEPQKVIEDLDELISDYSKRILTNRSKIVNPPSAPSPTSSGYFPMSGVSSAISSMFSQPSVEARAGRTQGMEEAVYALLDLYERALAGKATPAEQSMLQDYIKQLRGGQ